MNREALYTAMKTMVTETIKFSEENRGVYSNSPVSWSKEFRTVKFGVGRRMGHTTMITRLVNECGPEYSPRPAVLLLHSMTDGSASAARATWPMGTLVRPWQSDFDPLVKENPWAIFVDVACMMPTATFDRLIKTFVSVDPVYILVE